MAAAAAARASGRGRHGEDVEDSEWRRDMYCQPRNSLLLLTSEFVVKCSAKMQEISKKAGQEKPLELLDNKCFLKLVDVAHSLLKIAPYDLECMRLEGLQNYMQHVFPLTDWSVDTTRTSLTTIIRRLDKLFTKIQKSSKVYQVVDWDAAASLLKGIYLTIWKHPYIVNVPNLKSLIGTCQCLVAGEDSLTSLVDHHHLGVSGTGGSGRRALDLPPETFCTVVFQLISLQVLILGDTYTLEMRLQLSDHPAGGNTRHNLLTHDKGESLLLNLLLPLCLKIGCGKTDAPKMRKLDVYFSLNLLLNLINPAAQPRPTASGKDSLRASTTGVQYNPAGGDIRTKVKSSSLEIAFLG